MKRTILLAAGVTLAAASCKKAAPAPVYIAVPVERRDIVVTASAAGAVQPILTVAVKSQASGAVTEMHVQTGDQVRPGQLLALIDPRLPKSALDQARANLDQAQAQLDYAAAQMTREDTLFKARAVTQQEHESTRVSYEQAKAGVVNAKANLDDAQIAYDQTRVTAATAGTIIEKDVDIGTVISSPIHDVTGGTQMFKMANLDTVQVQAMVDETDIGKIEAGLPVSITVDAYPSRPFEGSVLKVEPQATLNQNVTQFPVDVYILNPGHLLKPGMNTEIEIHVGDRPNVLAIPTSALRTPKDVESAASVLGLDPQRVMQSLDVGQARSRHDAGAAAVAGQARRGEKRLAALGGGTRNPRRGRRPSQGADRGAGVGGPAPVERANYIVFTMRGGQPTAVPIQTGLSDLDYIEVTGGLAAGDSVLVLPSASLVQSQEQFKQRFQRFTGGGLPGLRQTTASDARSPGR